MMMERPKRNEIGRASYKVRYKYSILLITGIGTQAVFLFLSRQYFYATLKIQVARTVS